MKKLIGLSALVFFSTNTFAGNYFDTLWTKIENQSFAVQAASESYQASSEELKKANRHWIPNIYLGGATYITDDAGTNMFGLLSERAIKSSDFIPEALNRPGMNHFSKLTIGLELPLYEGGAGQGYKKVTEKMSKAEELNANATKSHLQSEYVKMFWGAKIYDQHDEAFSKKLLNLKKLENSYQLGSKENLLGYSGKLGMTNLGFKIQSLIDSVRGKKNSQLNALEELAQETIRRDELRAVDMESSYQALVVKGLVGNKYATDALGEKANAQQESVDLQKARLRPQVALFADQSFFKGDRELSDAKTVGISLRWSLFSKESLNLDNKAVFEAHSAKNAHLAYQQNDKIEFNALIDFEIILEGNLMRAMESKRVLAEQTVVTTRLFKNGMINILQLLEVLNQDVELSKNLLEIEEKLIEIRAKKLMFFKLI